MHVKYVSTTTASQAQIISDFAQLASGASISSLSASCDKTYTSSVNVTAPGWTLFDNAAPNSGQIISCSDADALTTKYVRIATQSASVIEIGTSETWNAGTHTGTNASTVIGTVQFVANTVNTYWLFITPRTFAVFSYVSNSLNLAIACEVAREIQYLKNSTYPVVYTGNLTAMIPTLDTHQGQMARMKSLTAAGDLLGSNSRAWTATLGMKYQSSATMMGPPTASIRMADETPYFEIRPMWLVNAVGPNSAIIGKLYDVMDITKTAGNTLDTISDGTNTYMMFIGSGSAGAIALKVA